MANTFNVFSMLDDDAPAPVVAKKEPKVEPVVKKPEAKPVKPDARNNRGSAQRGRDGERRGGRGRGRGGRGRGTTTKRDFDRHESGTGRGRGDVKKNGSGRGNWGVEGEQDQEDRPKRRFDREDRPRRNKPAEGEQAETSEEKPAEDGQKAEASEEKPAEKAEDAPEPEPEVISYDEFLANQAAAAPEDDRKTKVREVSNDGQWKDFAAKAAPVKEEEADYDLSGGPKKTGRSKKTRNGKKSAVSLDQFAKETPGGRGGRGGRGRGRGRGNGRGEGRGQKFKITADAFPSLGGK